MAGVYISYPFCAQKCTYCNFASGVLPKELEVDYRSALVYELKSYSWPWTPETVYLGGGTPSGMTAEALSGILNRVPGAPWHEATLEAAPGSFSLENARAWRQAGITRVSLGVQSFVRGELARTGRKHDAETVAADVAALRQAGVEEINIDLIAGLPGQTPRSWRESLDWIGRLQPPHVSVYILEVDEDSRLGLEILKGGTRYGAAGVPSEEIVVDLYETAVEYLAGIGLHRYEISNFARPGSESRHNLKYWRLEPYAGFGADAHSFDGSRRRRNAETADAYVERWRRDQAFSIEETTASPDEERFFLGLRLSEGIRPRAEEWRRYQEPIQRFLDGGLLERDNHLLRLTRRGVLLSNEVFQEFVNP